MRFVQSEKIILSQKESDIYCDFVNLMSGLARGTKNPNTERQLLKIRELISDFWEKLAIEEE